MKKMKTSTKLLTWAALVILIVSSVTPIYAAEEQNRASAPYEWSGDGIPNEYGDCDCDCDGECDSECTCDCS